MSEMIEVLYRNDGQPEAIRPIDNAASRIALVLGLPAEDIKLVLRAGQEIVTPAFIYRPRRDELAKDNQ